MGTFDQFNSDPTILDIDLGSSDIEKKSSKLLLRWIRYIIVLVISFLIVWLPVVMYTRYVPETYRSQWSIILPGSGVGSSVNLENLGQTSTSVATPYASNTVDPKVNYKEIALSLRVLKRAAEYSGIPVKDFKKPKIKLIDQTSIMHAVFVGTSAKEAFKYSKGLLDALEYELSELRRVERQHVETANLEQLSEYENKVRETQKDIFDFQASTLVVSSEQFSFALQDGNYLERSKNEVNIALSAVRGRVDALSSALKLSHSEATDALTLQQDQFLQSHLKNYLAQLGLWQEISSTLGSKHPKVKLARSRVDRASADMRFRARSLLPDVDSAFLDRYVSNQSGGNGNLYQELMKLHVDVKSSEAELAYLDKLLEESKFAVSQSALDAARLQELERNHQVANTIFLSAVAKLDLSQSDIYATYPMIQVLVAPTLPASPEKLRRTLAIIGASLGSVLIFLSLVLLWKRRELILKLSKRK